MSGISFPQRTSQIRRAAARLCLRMGWAPLHEVRLANGRRADIMAIDPKGCITIVEIKCSRADLRGDGKWHDYIDYCDYFCWAVPTGFALEPFAEAHFRPDITGLIVADRYDAEMLREPAHRPLNAARRKVETLRFARRAASRLSGSLDPGLQGLD